MVSTRQAGSSVHLTGNWQAKYRQRANELLSSSQSPSKPFSVCIVGRSGVGKGSLVNHLLQQRRAIVSHNPIPIPAEELVFDFHGLLIREIPSYDGLHTAAPVAQRRFHRHGSGSGSGSDSGGGRFGLEDFVQTYRIFEAETDAIIFVVNSRITADDQKLLSLALDHRKFFCVVRTHADGLVQIEDSSLQKERQEEAEEQLRRDFELGASVDIRIFIISIPWPESKETDSKLHGSDLQEVSKNIQNLNFPLLRAYLSEPNGLRDELPIHAYVKEEVSKALESFRNVKKRSQMANFCKHVVVGTLAPVLGPLMLTFFEMLHITFEACHEVGLIEDADEAMQTVKTEVDKFRLVGKVGSKEKAEAAVHDAMVQIFGKIVYEIAIEDVVSTAAGVPFRGALPVVGPVVTAAQLPGRVGKIADKLTLKACMLHELWIMQNVTGLLSTIL